MCRRRRIYTYIYIPNGDDLLDWCCAVASPRWLVHQPDGWWTYLKSNYWADCWRFSEESTLPFTSFIHHACMSACMHACRVNRCGNVIYSHWRGIHWGQAKSSIIALFQSWIINYDDEHCIYLAIWTWALTWHTCSCTRVCRWLSRRPNIAHATSNRRGGDPNACANATWGVLWLYCDALPLFEPWRQRLYDCCLVQVSKLTWWPAVWGVSRFCMADTSWCQRGWRD